MLADSGAAFKKAVNEHNSRPRHTKRLVEQLWPAEEFEIVPTHEMSVRSAACMALCT